jgi:hypothetical protein
MKNIWYTLLIGICFAQTSCEDFVEVDVSDNKIVSEMVFGSDETANSAVTGIYNELFKAEFSNGGFYSVSLLGGLSADEFRTTALNEELLEFGENEILAENSYNLLLWSSAYNIIYMCNAVMDGLEKYDGVSSAMKVQLLGETAFVRAFVYLYLVNLYGEVPLILSPDYRTNALASRSDAQEIYKSIISDLEMAITNLGDTFLEGQRIRPNKFTALALLARVHLYRENWEKAEEASTQVIGSTSNFDLVNNLDEVFLANSKEAIWQITPAGGGLSFATNEGRILILTSPPPDSQKPVALTNDLIGSYADVDIRKEHWIGKLDTEDEVYHYPFKYKVNSADVITEYSMVLRLAEQYLIRAEARAQLGKISESISDLNKIRARANIGTISAMAPIIGRDQLLDSLHLERRRELFTEWGHRWLDLKRTERASDVLGSIKTSWQTSDGLYPIPESEIDKNPNLEQNNGY